MEQQNRYVISCQTADNDKNWLYLSLDACDNCWCWTDIAEEITRFEDIPTALEIWEEIRKSEIIFTKKDDVDLSTLALRKEVYHRVMVLGWPETEPEPEFTLNDQQYQELMSLFEKKDKQEPDEDAKENSKKKERSSDQLGKQEMQGKGYLHRVLSNVVEMAYALLEDDRDKFADAVSSLNMETDTIGKDLAWKKEMKAFVKGQVLGDPQPESFNEAQGVAQNEEMSAWWLRSSKKNEAPEASEGSDQEELNTLAESPKPEQEEIVEEETIETDIVSDSRDNTPDEEHERIKDHEDDQVKETDKQDDGLDELAQILMGYEEEMKKKEESGRNVTDQVDLADEDADQQEPTQENHDTSFEYDTEITEKKDNAREIGDENSQTEEYEIPDPGILCQEDPANQIDVEDTSCENVSPQEETKETQELRNKDLFVEERPVEIAPETPAPKTNNNPPPINTQHNTTGNAPNIFGWRNNRRKKGRRR